jgi:Copper type II ascorbate-dependent monooxygenase, C-terminal domain
MKNCIILATLSTIIVSFILLPSCKKNKKDTPKDTWAIIQENIITTSCAKSGCHASTTDASYIQHKLVLNTANAYENLVNTSATNSNAITDGLMRVKPGDFAKSLLYQKIDCAAGYGTTNYGAKMPLGSGYLTNGQIEYVKQWIINGAPKTGSVVDENILTNTNVCVQPFLPLAPPLPGEGFQLKINQFDIYPNSEREVFIRRNTPNSTPVYVNKYVMRGRPNSHHFVLYGFQNLNTLPLPDTLRDLYNLDGSANFTTFLQMQNHTFLGGGTDVNSTYTFPTGVAMKVPAQTAIDLNAHYFNKTNANLPAENFVNFYTVPQSAVVKEAKTINFANYNFSLPPNQKTTITTDFIFPNAVTVIMLSSHYHKHGEKYIIKIKGGTRNGEVVYQSTDWEHPLTINLTTPIQLSAGMGLTSEVTYNNTTNATINFGLTSDDEMNIIFGYYY